MILKKKRFHLSLNSVIMLKHEIIREIDVWISANGDAKLYSKLDKNHLKNIIAKIERGDHESRLHTLFDLKNELDYRKLKENE